MTEKDAEDYMAEQTIEDGRIAESIAGFHFDHFVQVLERRLAAMEEKLESNHLQLARIENLLAQMHVAQMQIARRQRPVLPLLSPLHRRNNRRT